MRKLMVTAVAVLGVAVGYPAAEAKNAPQESGAAQMQQQTTGTENKAQDSQMAGKSDAKTQEVMGKVESVSGDSLSIRIPSKANRKMDRLKADAQSKIVKDARPATISELKEGDEVRVSYKIVGNERHLISVDATSAKAPAPTPEKKAP
ncbi:hypothetical protein D187_008297 [Cystobacter fuscus DSM 2262]|uniref:DUF5666 domain-containing protein n=1 Tax=Cystobacter fuscus (strain ATCC 25194 / DSM 2262 / NBRC 100088 / M29) TaxID=1242864 RepID=S9NXY6_CYSF2|nr:hypothetical protein [Cystobacter fuscus]EPX55736.1 hypothetical protein D187_008297 [Cystobacter fuscus DSM 2262]